MLNQINYVILIDTDLTSQFTELREKFWGRVLVVSHWDLQCLIIFELERIKNHFNKQILLYKKMASITTEKFEAQVKEQKPHAIKWRELKFGKIYTIVDVKFINTQYGKACILTLSDEKKVLNLSALINRLKLDNKPCPRYVRQKVGCKPGEIQIKHTMILIYIV